MTQKELRSLYPSKDSPPKLSNKCPINYGQQRQLGQEAKAHLGGNKRMFPLKESHLTKMPAQQSEEQKKRMHLSKNDRKRETEATNR